MHYVYNTHVCIYTTHMYMHTHMYADHCKLQQAPAPPAFCQQSFADHVFHILQHQAPSTYLQTITHLYYKTTTSITTTTTTTTATAHKLQRQHYHTKGGAATTCPERRSFKASLNKDNALFWSSTLK